jgi:hypothetical protein
MRIEQLVRTVNGPVALMGSGLGALGSEAEAETHARLDESNAKRMVRGQRARLHNFCVVNCSRIIIIINNKSSPVLLALSLTIIYSPLSSGSLDSGLMLSARPL